MFTLLFTAFAQPVSLSTDLDGDAEMESIQVQLHDGHLVVHFEEGGVQQTLDLGEHRDIMGPMTEVRATKVDGAPLIAVHLPAGEYCGSGNTWIYLSYVDETLRSALQVYDYFDAPLSLQFELSFGSHGHNARIVQTTYEGDGQPQTTVQNLQFIDGIYQ